MQSLWMIVATFLFSLMAVCAKLAATEYNTGEIIFFRGVIGVVILLITSRVQGTSVATKVLAAHVRRSIVGLGSLCLGLTAVILLPLPTAASLSYTTPLWMVIMISLPRFNGIAKQVDLSAVAIAIIGFGGVALLLQPSFDSNSWVGGVMGLLGAGCAALAYGQIRAMADIGEPSWRIVFYFSLGCTLLGLVWMTFAGIHALTWKGTTLLSGVGIFGLLGQLAVTRSLGAGNTFVSTTFQYTGVLFATLWGGLLWHDYPNRVGVLGMLIIILCGALTTLRNVHKPRRV